MIFLPDVSFACRDVTSHQVKGLHTEHLQVAESRAMTDDDDGDDDDDFPSVKQFT